MSAQFLGQGADVELGAANMVAGLVIARLGERGHRIVPAFGHAVGIKGVESVDLLTQTDEADRTARRLEWAFLPPTLRVFIERKCGSPVVLGRSVHVNVGASISHDCRLGDYTILAPANPGGGWDQTGRAMQKDLQDNDLVDSAQVVNVGGAGGTVGLTQLANERDPNTLMVMGLVMVGAIWPATSIPPTSPRVITRGP